MKKLNAKKEILVIMVIVALMLGISSQVFATGTLTSPITINVINTDANPATTPEPVNPTPVNPTPVNTTPVTPTTNTVSNYEDETLPQTGDASDYAIFFVIIVAVIIAVYAFKKSKDYKF